MVSLRRETRGPTRLEDEEFYNKKPSRTPMTKPQYPQLLRQQVVPYNPNLPPAAFPSLPLDGSQAREANQEPDPLPQDATAGAATDPQSENTYEIFTAASRWQHKETVTIHEADGSDGDMSDVGDHFYQGETIAWSTLELSVQIAIFVNLCQSLSPRGAAQRLGMSDAEFLDTRHVISCWLQSPVPSDLLWDALTQELGYIDPADSENQFEMLLGAGSYDLAFPLSVTKGLHFLDQMKLDRALIGEWVTAEDGYAHAATNFKQAASRIPLGNVNAERATHDVRETANTVPPTTHMPTTTEMHDGMNEDDDHVPASATKEKNDSGPPQHPQQQKQPKTSINADRAEAAIHHSSPSADAIGEELASSKSRVLSDAREVPRMTSADLQPRKSLPITPDDSLQTRTRHSEERSAGGMQLRNRSTLKATERQAEWEEGKDFWHKSAPNNEDPQRSGERHSSAPEPFSLVVKLQTRSEGSNSTDGVGGIQPYSSNQQDSNDASKASPAIVSSLQIASVASVSPDGNRTPLRDDSAPFVTPPSRNMAEASQPPSPAIKPEPHDCPIPSCEDVEMEDVEMAEDHATPAAAYEGNKPARNFGMRLIESPNANDLVSMSNDGNIAGVEGEVNSRLHIPLLEHESSPLVHKSHHNMTSHRISNTPANSRTSTPWRAPPSSREDADAEAVELDRGSAVSAPDISPTMPDAEVLPDRARDDRQFSPSHVANPPKAEQNRQPTPRRSLRVTFKMPKKEKEAGEEIKTEQQEPKTDLPAREKRGVKKVGRPKKKSV